MKDIHQFSFEDALPRKGALYSKPYPVVSSSACQITAGCRQHALENANAPGWAGGVSDLSSLRLKLGSLVDKQLSMMRKAWTYPKCIKSSEAGDYDSVRAYLQAAYCEQEHGQVCVEMGVLAACGSRLVRVTDGLMSNLSATDLSGAQFSWLDLPMNHFYLQFPRASAFTLSDGAVVLDGVQFSLMREAPGQVDELYLTLVGYKARGDSAVAPAVVLKADVAPGDEMAAIVDKFVSRHEEESRSLQSDLELPSIFQIESAIRAPIVDESKADALFQAYSRYRRTRTIASLRADSGQLGDLLRTVLNCLLYLSSYPEDLEERYPAEAPEKLVKQAIAGSVKESTRADSKLRSLGFRKILQVGRRFEEMTLRSADGVQVERKGGLRRGSWVLQPHGPKHSLRRLQWRSATIVKGVKDGFSGQTI